MIFAHVMSPVRIKNALASVMKLKAFKGLDSFYRREEHGFDPRDFSKEEDLKNLVRFDDLSGTSRVDNVDVIPLLVSAVQEQQQAILKLQEEINSLKMGKKNGT